MTDIYKPSDLIQVVKSGKKPPNCDLTLQIDTNYALNGIAHGIWKVDERFLNGKGIVMGGFVASAADIIMAYAISSLLDEGKTFASIDLHTTFHRPVFPGEVKVEAKVEKMGKTVAYVIANLNQNEKKVASVVSSVMIISENN